MEHETLFPLLCETANGNKAAFAELYKLTSPQLYAVVLKLLKRRNWPTKRPKMRLSKYGITLAVTNEVKVLC